MSFEHHTLSDLQSGWIGDLDLAGFAGSRAVHENHWISLMISEKRFMLCGSEGPSMPPLYGIIPGLGSNLLERKCFAKDSIRGDRLCFQEFLWPSRFWQSAGGMGG